MTVYESEIPGVGRKFELDVGDGGRVVVVVHHDGRREVFNRPSPDADSEKLLDLGVGEARQLAAVLQGTGFETVDVDSLSAPIGEAIIEWHEVVDGGVAGRTLGELDLRGETGASVVAVQRGEETEANPGGAFELATGDVLVALGTRAEQSALADRLGAD